MSIHITGGVTFEGGSSITNSGLVLSLDAGNPSSYPGSGSTWTDLVSAKTFTLYGSPTYSSNNGGYISFDVDYSQYAQCNSSLSTLNTWTVEAWHYYTGNNAGVDAGAI
mgnify:FL=1